MIFCIELKDTSTHLSFFQPFTQLKDLFWCHAFIFRQRLITFFLTHLSHTFHISNSDSWIEVLRPKDFESVKQLERAAISICHDLRNENIDFNEAEYRWKTELQWFDDHLPKEAAQYYLKQLIGPIRALIEKIFKD